VRRAARLCWIKLLRRDLRFNGKGATPFARGFVFEGCS
jgi:hypothetical protein